MSTSVISWCAFVKVQKNKFFQVIQAWTILSLRSKLELRRPTSWMGNIITLLLCWSQDPLLSLHATHENGLTVFSVAFLSPDRLRIMNNYFPILFSFSRAFRTISSLHSSSLQTLLSFHPLKRVPVPTECQCRSSHCLRIFPLWNTTLEESTLLHS